MYTVSKDPTHSFISETPKLSTSAQQTPSTALEISK